MESVRAYAVYLWADSLALWAYSAALGVDGVGMGLCPMFRGE